MKHTFTNLKNMYIELTTAGSIHDVEGHIGTISLLVPTISGKQVKVLLPNSMLIKEVRSNMISLRSMLIEGLVPDFKLNSGGTIRTPSGDHIQMETDIEGAWMFPWNTTNSQGIPINGGMKRQVFNSRLSTQALTTQARTESSTVKRPLRSDPAKATGGVNTPVPKKRYPGLFVQENTKHSTRKNSFSGKTTRTEYSWTRGNHQQVSHFQRLPRHTTRTKEE
jgi:hypothetical protein